MGKTGRRGITPAQRAAARTDRTMAEQIRRGRLLAFRQGIIAKLQQLAIARDDALEDEPADD
jgi:hypothetical protein